MLQVPKSNPSLADQAHRKLEELIVTLELPPGSTYSEFALSDLVGIGRTPVREAVKRLEAGRLLETVPRHGVRVSRIDLYEQLQVIELRADLERLISSWAAIRAMPAERKQLLEMATEFEEAAKRDDIHAYLRAVFVANQYIAQCARNPFASAAIAPLFGLSRRFYYVYHEELANLSEVSRLHSERGRAVAMGDAAIAEQAAVELMKRIEDFTRKIFMREAGRSSP
ncbi:GntR family transcriptional regulator [Paraburkholderia sabiae]|uniref:GntR family transcriptional regulator n=1 Tax=Paraburkholderia sabiae TaxID=273251 RepID=A0ABU9QAH7_9BURK|nr:MULTISPECIES: GntR family transcriptional regulator [Burkholderiaceae]MDR5877761.1 GntR family transcriptional regulator [Caballeronia sp. LZ032]WJZ75469.1 GntR family transcriptional regulator [Paraburkholderia sabiae]CAD6535303.1 hypothetical protein LMG24235_03007 [Paraburkholderia sabiae]